MEEPRRRGRPKGSVREPKTRRVEIKVSESEIELLNRISIEEDMPVSQVIRKAIRLYGNTWGRDYYF